MICREEKSLSCLTRNHQLSGNGLCQLTRLPSTRSNYCYRLVSAPRPRPALPNDSGARACMAHTARKGHRSFNARQEPASTNAGETAGARYLVDSAPILISSSMGVAAVFCTDQHLTSPHHLVPAGGVGHKQHEHVTKSGNVPLLLPVSTN